MLTVSAVITAAGKNSRMRKDQENLNIPIQNKLTLPLKNGDDYICVCKRKSDKKKSKFSDIG